MASEPKKTKADPAAKSAPAAAKDKGAPSEAGAKTPDAGKTPDITKASPSETLAGETTAPSNYSRGEGQKPVTAAYKENWNAIFAKKSKKKKSSDKKK